jgi:CRP-like cAMP-binding protein
MAGWATLKLFGYEGYQVILGRIIETQIFLRELLKHDKNLVCVNPDNHGFVTLFRVYPKHINAEKQFEKELYDPDSREELKAYNLLQQRVANKLFAMLRDPEQKVAGWENPPYTSFTAGYRKPEYAPDEEDSKYFIYALKAFPMSPNSNELSMQIVRNYVLKARDLVIEELIKECGSEEDHIKELKQKSDVRTTDNWYGDNEYIPLNYLTSSEKLSVEDTLNNIPFCSHLSYEQIKDLLSNSKKEKIQSDVNIVNEGDKADKVYLILSGKVKVYKTDKDGNETELAIIDEGNMFGEMALFDNGIRSASVKTTEKCEFIIFDGKKFLELSLG